MKRLLAIELIKIKNYPIFWVFTILYLFSCVGFATFIADAELGPGLSAKGLGIYSFPTVWQTTGSVFGFCMILLALIMLIFSITEFQYKTFRQSIINGMNKGELVLGKIYLIIFLCIVSTLGVFLTALVLGFIFTEDMSAVSMFDNFSFVIAYFVQIFTFLMFGFMVGVLVRKSGLAIIIVSVYYIIFERVLNIAIPDHIDQFFPAKAIDNVVPNPLANIFAEGAEPGVSIAAVGICLAWAFIFTAISYYSLMKRDI